MDQNGTLTANQPFDYETFDQNQTLVVRAFDDHNATLDKNFTITVTNVVEDLDGDGTEDHYDDDIDGDGILNDADADSNGDGNVDAGKADTDGDGIADTADDDMDGDGIPNTACLLYTSPSPRDKRQSRMPSSA